MGKSEVSRAKTHSTGGIAAPLKERMPLDGALVGSIVTGLMGLAAQAISKCKCVLRTGDDGPTFSCGFMDGAIEPLPHEEDDDQPDK